MQDLIAGTTEKAQSVFCRGNLLGFHAYRQIAAGVGGGEAIKQSVSRPAVRAYLEKIGEQLDWHGALSVDYHHARRQHAAASDRLQSAAGRTDERVSLAGVDLVGLLLGSRKAKRRRRCRRAARAC